MSECECVLIAESDPDVRGLITFVLTRAGYQVVAVSNGPAAYRELITHPPALAVMDARLPRISCTEALARARRSGAYRGPVVLLHTGRMSAADQGVALALGVRAFVTMPFSPRRFVQTVVELLGTEQAHV